MSTILPNFFSINGVVSTDRTVMQNVTALCDATGVFLTYDINEGMWGVTINAPTAVSKSFDDSNIIGAVNISGSGINEMYNAVSFEFPHKDIRDQTDYIELKTAEADRYAFELDNELTMSTDLVNDPAVAMYLAGVELKQSRLDKVINFSTDYSSIGLKASNIISVTNVPLGFVNKQFRVTRIVEDEEDALTLNITALEFDDSIYSTDDLIRTYRTKKTGITPKAANTVLTASEDAASTNSVANSFVIPAISGAAAGAAISMLTNMSQYHGVMVSATAGTNTYSDLPTAATYDPSVAADIVMDTIAFIPTVTGKYSSTITINQLTSGCAGGRGGWPSLYPTENNDYISVTASIYDSSFNFLVGDASGGFGVFYWSDFVMGYDTTLTAGRTYYLEFTYNVYSGSLVGYPADFTVNWNIYTVAS